MQVRVSGRRRWQPARDVLRAQRWSVRAAADELGETVTVGHLHCALTGITAPNEAVRVGLPALLGVALEELFEPDLLNREWSGHRDGRSTPATNGDAA